MYNGRPVSTAQCWALTAIAFLLTACQAGGRTDEQVDRETVTQEPGNAFAPVETPEPFNDHESADAYPTLVDFWEGRATFVVDVVDSGLPMGESDTIVRDNGEFWSYLHASQESAGTVDQCGDPAPFPGCTVIYRSTDGGKSFFSDDPPICQFACTRCPCESEQDHIDQQQYPRLIKTGDNLALVYEYRARIMVRRSNDGLTWSQPELIAGTGLHDKWLGRCPPDESIGEHPFALHEFDCLAGGPPGLFAEGDSLYIFTAMGQNPGAMGCFHGPLEGAGDDFQRCEFNPLFVGADEYGLLEASGREANQSFDFRTISAAEVTRIGQGEAARYYMFYEGIRGPGPGNSGDSQFGLGLARSLTNHIDGPWEKYPGNPILIDLPGNVGLGHADYLVHDGQTYLFVSIDGQNRSRLTLVWK